MNYIRRENQGQSRVRNTAVLTFSGEFVALLDASDEWLPCRLARIVKNSRRASAGLYCLGHGDPYRRKWWLGRTFKGNPKYPEGHIAPQIYICIGMSSLIPPLRSEGDASMRSERFDEAMLATGTAIFANGSLCDRKSRLSPGSSPTTW
jgi:glycosyltransferase involved in cell wall biosynthesis